MPGHSDAKIQIDGLFFDKIKIWNNVVRGRRVEGRGKVAGGSLTPYVGH